MRVKFIFDEQFRCPSCNYALLRIEIYDWFIFWENYYTACAHCGASIKMKRKELIALMMTHDLIKKRSYVSKPKG